MWDALLVDHTRPERHDASIPPSIVAIKPGATLDGFSSVARYMAVASDGRYFLAIWSDEDSLRAAQFRSFDGVFIDRTTIVPPRPGHAPNRS